MTTKKKAFNTDAIRKQAEKLFALIEAHLEEHGDDTIAETLVEQMGGFIKSAKGFDLLQYAFLLAQTRSETATMDFEESVRHMKDRHLSELYTVVRYAVEVVDILEDKSPYPARLPFIIEDIKKHGPDLRDCMASEFEWRANGYRDEIKELKNKLKETGKE